MEDKLDKKKMMDLLMDPDVSTILVELEDGEKDSIYLERKLGISSNEIKRRLTYLIQYRFVMINESENKVTYSVEKDKLDSLMESEEHFGNIVDGLTELDQYLN